MNSVTITLPANVQSGDVLIVLSPPPQIEAVLVDRQFHVEELDGVKSYWKLVE